MFLWDTSAEKEGVCTGCVLKNRASFEGQSFQPLYGPTLALRLGSSDPRPWEEVDWLNSHAGWKITVGALGLGWNHRTLSLTWTALVGCDGHAADHNTARRKH